MVFATLVKRVKKKSTRKNVNNPRTRRKFLVMWVKRRKYFVKSIIHINDRTFDHFPLTRDEQIQ